MKKLLQKLNRWFDLNLSWFVVNGRKQDEHAKRLKEKYGKGNQINGRSILLDDPRYRTTNRFTRRKYNSCIHV